MIKIEKIVGLGSIKEIFLPKLNYFQKIKEKIDDSYRDFKIGLEKEVDDSKEIKYSEGFNIY